MLVQMEVISKVIISLYKPYFVAIIFSATVWKKINEVLFMANLESGSAATGRLASLRRQPGN